MPILPRILLIAALAVAAGACTDTETQQAELAELRGELAAREAVDRAVEERLIELEAMVADLEADDTGVQRLEELSEQLARLDDAVTALEVDLALETATREELAEGLDTATGDLRRSVAGLQNSVDGLRGEVEELRTLYTTLRDRLDRTQQ